MNTIHSYDIYDTRSALQGLRDKLQIQKQEAEDADAIEWKWYDSLSEKEYFANQQEADRRVDATSKALTLLREQLTMVEEAIAATSCLYEALGDIETEGLW